MRRFLTKSLPQKEEYQIKDKSIAYLYSELENIALIEQTLAKSEVDFSLLIEISDKIYSNGNSYGFPLISILGKRIEIAAIEKDTYMLSALISSLKPYLETSLKKLYQD